jgi:hypothetical protein
MIAQTKEQSISTFTLTHYIEKLFKLLQEQLQMQQFLQKTLPHFGLLVKLM